MKRYSKLKLLLILDNYSSNDGPVKSLIYYGEKYDLISKTNIRNLALP